VRKQLYQIATFKKALASSLILVLFLVGCAHNLEGKYDNLTTIEGYKNIVLMIGDGMGENHIKVAEAFNQARSTITEEAEISGWMTIASLSSSITDSAASATAMSTGEKVANRAIAYKNGLKLTTMSEFARAFQKGVGIIATETLTGATPAAFYAHNRKRSNTDEIALEQFRSNVDLFIGAGKSYYDEQIELIRQNNLDYYTDFSILETDINAAIAEDSSVLRKFLAAFDSISTSTSTSSTPTLSDISTASLNYLDYKYQEKGFFLMIEGSHIDKRAHDKDIFGMIEQLNGFDAAVNSVLNWSEEHGETFVVVTADHETGGLEFNGETKSEIDDDMFTISGHTATNVPFYIYNTSNLSFISEGDIIDNTDVAKLIRAMIRATS
jgi:alkaline phosphatase